jgi:2-oxoglutarate dehydrogenase E1 component
MSRQDANAAFALTSFLDGGNAAYIEDLYARYLTDPNAVDAEWQAFFQSLKDGRAEVSKAAAGPSWRRPNRPQRPQREQVAALTGDWSEVEKAVSDKIKANAQGKGVELSEADVQQATRDSIHALMLIRAYRARGHFHAHLDPLGLEPEKNEHELDPSSYGFSEADMDRPIFLDKVLAIPTLADLAILRLSHCHIIVDS